MLRSTHIFFKSLRIIAVFAMLVLGISSCNNLPNNGIPIYIAVDSPSVTYNSAYGSNSFSIPGVWATVGSHNLGAYEMPIKIPVLAAGDALFALSAGIYDNGIVNAPAPYPFYNPDTFTIHNPIPGQIYHHKPIYSYVVGTQFALNEGFDNTNYFTNVTVMRNTVDSSVYQGLGSGGIIIPPTADTAFAFQTIPIAINTNGRQAYIELNYKINNPDVLCEVGIIATLYSGGSITDQEYLGKIELALNSSRQPSWRKIYVDFNNEIGSRPNYDFQVYFLARHMQGRADTMFVDNVKLLYLH